MNEQKAFNRIKIDLESAKALKWDIVTVTVGALEKVCEMAEKQTPRKPKVFNKFNNMVVGCECPFCGQDLYGKYLFCCVCGQSIDWSRE